MKKRNWRLMLRRVLNLVFSRIVVTGVLLLLQAFWLFALFYWLAYYAKWFGGVGVAMSIIMCLALIRQDSTVPEFKISWMILFAVMPVQGGILYLLWGNKRPALGLRHRLERAEDAMAPARKDDPDAAAALQRQDPRAALTARYLHDYGPMPVCGGTAVKYYPDGQSMFADMLPDLICVIEKPGMFVIDEFGNSLHNRLAERIIKFFMEKASNSQMFVTSHDTNLFSNSILRPDQINLLTFMDAKGSCVKRVSEFKPREAQNLEKMYLGGMFEGLPSYEEVQDR